MKLTSMRCEDNDNIPELPDEIILKTMIDEMLQSEEWNSVDSAIRDLVVYYNIKETVQIWNALTDTEYSKWLRNPVVGFIKGTAIKRTSLINYSKKALTKVFDRGITRGMTPINIIKGLAVVYYTDVDDIITKLKKTLQNYYDKITEKEIKNEC